MTGLTDTLDRKASGLTADAKQKHIWYEVCDEHGMFMDAGEFSDYKHETWADWFRSLIKGALGVSAIGASRPSVSHTSTSPP